MSNTMTMTSPIRRITGYVNINLFANGSDTAVKIKSSTKNTAVTDLQTRQIFMNKLLIEPKFAFFDGRTTMDGKYYLLDEKSNSGWIGNSIDISSGNPQSIETQFLLPRRLPYIEVKGLSKENHLADNDEYPIKFNLTFYFKPGTIPASYTKTVTGNNTPDYWFDEKDKDYANIANKVIERVKIDIFEWNIKGILPRITYFSGEMNEGFTGDRLQSIEILEEKSGDIEKLSYGISSNYCKVNVLNENHKYFEQDNYNLLRKNLFVEPVLNLGDPENPYHSAPLGKFYSEEWTVPSDSQFMTCKAYDILYSLKTLYIRYPYNWAAWEANRNNIPLPTPANSLVMDSNVSLKTIIKRIFDLVNDERQKNGIFGEDIICDIDLLEDFNVQYALLGEDTAWNMLQAMANVARAYIYVNREGKVVISSDKFGIDNRPPSPDMPVVDGENAFQYNLPASSKSVVNCVNTEYYELTTEGKEEDNKLEIKLKDCIISESGNVVSAVLELKNFFPTIESITVASGGSNLQINAVTFDKVYVQLTVADKNNLEQPVAIYINNTANKNKLEKRTASKEATDSIKVHGLYEFDYKTQAVLFEKTLSATLVKVNSRAQEIIDKYGKGLPYLDTHWTGDDTLKLGDVFTAKSPYVDEFVSNYECMSNEITLDSAFRQQTKGRALKITL